MAREERGTVTIESLLESGAIAGHQDGNHGSLYPRVEEFGSVGVPFLTAKSLSDGKIDIEGAPRLADDKADALRLGFVQPGDILLSHNATVGRVAVVPEFTGRVLIGTSLTYFRVDPSKILPRYLAAYFSGSDFQNQLAAVMGQSTRNQVPITAQRRLRVVLPPLATQRAIAHILGTLDDKIELNRRMNETLDAMARSLFKSWFSDFDPVRAKAAGRDPDLPKPLTDLFPDSFEDSEVGEIPKGWDVGTIGTIASRIMDKVEEPAAWQDLPLIDLRRMPQRSIALNEWGTGAELTTSVTRFKAKDTLFGAIRPYFHKVGVAPMDGVTNVSVFVLRGKQSTDWPYVTMLCSMAETVAYATRVAKGTKMPVVSWPDFQNYPVAIPPVGVRHAFARIAALHLDRIVNNIHSAQTLVATRDTLLHELISGDLQVRDAGRVVGATSE